MKWVFHKHVRQMFLLVVLAGVAVLAYLHFWGLPDRIKQAVISELAKRGINAEIGSLTFDPWRGFVAEELAISLPGSDRASLRADEVRLKLAVGPLFKRQVVVEELAFSDTDFSCELMREGGGTYPVEISDVEGVFGFDARQTLIIKNLHFKFLNLAFEVEGALGTKQSIRPAPGEGRKPIVLKTQWVDLLERWHQVKMSRPLTVHVTVAGDVERKETLAVTARLNGKDVQYNGLSIRQARGEVRWRPEAVDIDHLALETTEGKIEVQGSFPSGGSDAKAEVRCEFVPGLAAHFLPADKRKYLTEWRPVQPAVLKASLEAAGGDWKSAHANIQLDVGAFSYDGVPFRNLSVKAEWVPGRLTVPEFILMRDEGNLNASFQWSRDTDLLNFKIDSFINLDDFEPIFEESARNAFKTFMLKKAPVLQIEGASVLKDPNTLKASGALEVKEFEGNGIPIKQFKCKLAVEGPVIRIDKVEVLKKEGKLTGDFVLNTRTGDLTVKAVSTIYPIDLATIIGPRTKSMIESYHFQAPPKITWNGVCNVKKSGLNDLRMDVSCAKFNWWKLNLTGLTAKVWLGPRSVEVSDLKSAFHSGTLRADLIVDLTDKDSKVGFTIDLKNVNFKPLTHDLFGYKEVEGKLSGSAWAAGVTGRAETWVGDGNLVIEDGELWKIPILGGLSQVLGTVIPGFGSPKAKYAETKFKLQDAYALLDDIKIESWVVSMTAKGKYFFDQRLDFVVQGHVLRKLFFIGWFLDPLTKIGEMRLTGTLQKWEWNTRYIPGL